MYKYTFKEAHTTTSQPHCGASSAHVKVQLLDVATAACHYANEIPVPPDDTCDGSEIIHDSTGCCPNNPETTRKSTRARPAIG
jgi:hypothetical protein